MNVDLFPKGLKISKPLEAHGFLILNYHFSEKARSSCVLTVVISSLVPFELKLFLLVSVKEFREFKSKVFSFIIT